MQHNTKSVAIDSIWIQDQISPIGLSESKPVFRWILTSSEQNTIQKNWRLEITDGETTFWDTGVILDSASVNHRYQGSPLKPLTRYSIHLTVEDNHGNVAKKEGWFETGVLDYSSLSADFITRDGDDPAECHILFTHAIIEKPISRAWLVASALGLYHFDINGKKVGDSYLTPFWTNYNKRLEFQTYDVTRLLDKKENLLEMTIVPGWYQGSFGFMRTENIYGKTIAGFAEIHIRYQDGSHEVIKTNLDWKSKMGPIVSSSIYDGENWDFTRYDPAIRPTIVVPFDKAKLIPQENEPVRVVTTLKPVSKFVSPKGESIVDFGQNHSGFVKMSLSGTKGQVIRIRHAEVLDQSGNLYTDNLRTAKATDTFILSGGFQTLQPLFTFHGYRFIAIEGASLDEVDIESLVISSDTRRTGWLKTDYSDINRLIQNIEWGQIGNFVDVPTDCPQRDERMGWTGDAQVFAKTACYQQNVKRFFEKWLRDLASEQGENGAVPKVIPAILGSNDEPAAVWGDAATIIPWTIYEFYGDEGFLQEQWPSMKKWVEFVKSKTKDGLWVSGNQLGDWLALDVFDPSDKNGGTDRFLVTNAYYLNSIKILIDTAKVLGFGEEKICYQELYDKTLSAFQKEYISPNGRLVCETETAYALGIAFDLFKNPDWKEKAAGKFREIVNKNNVHLVTGFAGTPYLCPALSQSGSHDLAAQLLTNDDYPSWLYSVKKGGTTIWERWNGIKADGTFFSPEMNSFNHYAYGSIGGWIYEYVAGIRPLEPGFKKISIAPRFTKGLSKVTAEHDSPYGKIVSSYEVSDGTAKIHIEIPVNTTAEVHLPEKTDSFWVGSGSYDYSYPTEADVEYTRFRDSMLIGDLLAIPGYLETMNQFAPGMFRPEYVSITSKMKVSDVAKYGNPGMKSLFEKVYRILEKRPKAV